MGETVSYSQRFNLLERYRTYHLDEDAVVWEDEEGEAGRMAYGDIARVRLSSWPDLQAGTVYAVISPRRGKALKLSNRSYVSPGNFDMQQDAFAVFLRALHQKLAAHGEDVSYRLGATGAGYAATIFICCALFIFIAGTIYAVLADASAIMGAVAVVIMLGFVPWLGRFLIAARPGTYRPGDLNPS
ncbi:MAG: hypothetical protein R3D43_02190 [Tepidamorphaceae bacterium]